MRATASFICAAKGSGTTRTTLSMLPLYGMVLYYELCIFLRQKLLIEHNYVKKERMTVSRTFGLSVSPFFLRLLSSVFPLDMVWYQVRRLRVQLDMQHIIDLGLTVCMLKRKLRVAKIKVEGV